MTINDVPRDLQVEIYLALKKEEEKFLTEQAEAQAAELAQAYAEYSSQDSCTKCGGDVRGHNWPYCECMPDIEEDQPEVEAEDWPRCSNCGGC